MLPSTPLLKSAATVIARGAGSARTLPPLPTRKTAPWNLALYDRVYSLFEEFCLQQGMLKSQPQAQPSILTACEDHRTLQTYTLGGMLYAMTQTGQMTLESDLLSHGKDLAGVFCETTSYRDEPKETMDPRRHLSCFCMLEAEAWGTFDDMLKFQEGLLGHMGFPAPIRVNYTEVADYYGVEVLENEHEARLAVDVGPVVQLCYFPEASNPYANMKRLENGLSAKCDVIIDGIEVIGSAERSCDVDDMRHRFQTISDGEFIGTLYRLFGRERVDAELEEYLSLFSDDVDQRHYGMGIGATRLMAAYAARNPVYGDSPTPHAWPTPAMVPSEAFPALTGTSLPATHA